MVHIGGVSETVHVGGVSETVLVGFTVGGSILYEMMPSDENPILI